VSSCSRHPFALLSTVCVESCYEERCYFRSLSHPRHIPLQRRRAHLMIARRTVQCVTCACQCLSAAFGVAQLSGDRIRPSVYELLRPLPILVIWIWTNGPHSFSFGFGRTRSHCKWFFPRCGSQQDVFAPSRTLYSKWLAAHAIRSREDVMRPGS